MAPPGVLDHLEVFPDTEDDIELMILFLDQHRCEYAGSWA